MFKEQLAALCHEQWSGWMKYLFSKCYPTSFSGGIVIPEWAVKRWKHQMETPYEDLSDEEKDSDRKEADKFLKVLQEALDPYNPSYGPDFIKELPKL